MVTQRKHRKLNNAISRAYLTNVTRVLKIVYMTAGQAHDILVSIRAKAEKAFAESCSSSDSKSAFMLGYMQYAFENELKLLVYESTNDN